MLVEIKQKFDERLYRWALNGWKREIENDFPLLRGAEENLVVNMMGSLQSDEIRLIFAKGLLKRGRDRQILSQWGDPFTDEEQELVQQYVDMVTGVVMGTVHINTGKWRDTKEKPKRLNRKKFKNLIIETLIPTFGVAYQDRGDWKEWVYKKQIGPWKLVTSIDIGGSLHQLCYEHSIMLSERVRLVEGLSIVRWLGIGGQTEWTSIDDSDAEATAKVLAKIASHFTESAPKLLEGLSPDCNTRNGFAL